MGRRLRYIPPGGALVEVTCRVMQARFLLRPSPALRDLTLGVLGRGQRLYGVGIIGFVFLSNHYHLLLRVRDAHQLARFVGHLNSNLAREAGRLYQWRERFWGRRYQAIVVSEEPAAQLGRLSYLMRQGVKEGLVEDPRDWPGATSVPAMLDGRTLVGKWIDRTAEWRAARRQKPADGGGFASAEPVVLAPLPLWEHLSAADRRSRALEVLDWVRAEAAAGARERHGRARPDVDEVLAHDPHHRTPHSSRDPAPWVHAASLRAHLAFLQAYRIFSLAFRRASEAMRRDEAAAGFPEGCFPPARRFIPSPHG